MTGASPASATGLPQILPSLIDPLPRRGFLRGLAKLPLIGGSIKLLGEPTGVAEPITDDLLWSYKDWLHYEHSMLSYELAGHDYEHSKLVRRWFRNANDWHLQWCKEGARGPAGWTDAPQPSTRAAVVLSAVGCDWRAQP